MLRASVLALRTAAPVPESLMPAITQAMIELYDYYTHVGLDRRALMAGMARLTGSAAAAAAVIPLLEASPAAASIVAPRR